MRSEEASAPNENFAHKIRLLRPVLGATSSGISLGQARITHISRAYIFQQKGVRGSAYLSIVAGDKISDAVKYISSTPPFNQYRLLRGFDDGFPQSIIPASEATYQPKDGELRIYLEVGDISLYHASRKTGRFLPDLTFTVNSFSGLHGLVDVVQAAVQLDRAKKALTPVGPFRLVQFVGKDMVILNEANLLERVATDKRVYIDFLQPLYSRTTNSIIDKFTWPEGLDISKTETVYETLISDHNTGGAVVFAEGFIRSMNDKAKSSSSEEQKTGQRWASCVASATKAINARSTVIPALGSHNEATRRLFINELILHASVFLGRTMMVDAYQCVSQPNPPSHFQGTGTLDYLVGAELRTCVVVYPRDVHCASAFTEEDEWGLPEDEDPPAGPMLVELQPQDPLSVIVTPITDDVEAKQRANLSALRHLLAQIHDRAYVSAKEIMYIAKNCTALTTEQSTDKNKPAARKRKVDFNETAVRKNKELTGILTTGHTWQVFRFAFDEYDMHDPAALMRIEYAGSICLPVLQYAGPSAQGGKGGGAEAVKEEDVAKVMAALVMTSMEINAENEDEQAPVRARVS